MLDVEGLVEPGAKLPGIGEKADLGSLADKQPTETRVKPTHNRSLRSRATRRAIADVAHLVGENLAVEPLDPRGHVWFVGEQLDPDPAQLVEHYAAGHFCRTHEGETKSLGQEDIDLDELTHHQRR